MTPRTHIFAVTRTFPTSRHRLSAGGTRDDLKLRYEWQAHSPPTPPPLLTHQQVKFTPYHHNLRSASNQESGHHPSAKSPNSYLTVCPYSTSNPTAHRSFLLHKNSAFQATPTHKNHNSPVSHGRIISLIATSMVNQ